MPVPRISHGDFGELAFWGYLILASITLVVLILLNIFSWLGFYEPLVLVNLVGAGTVALPTAWATMVAGWWITRAFSTKSEEAIRASIEDATSQTLRSPAEILQRAALIVKEANQDGCDGMLLVCLPSPILYHDLYGADTAFCEGLLQRAKDDLPTLVCFCDVDGFFSKEGTTWQNSRMAHFYAVLRKVAPEDRELASYRTDLLQFFAKIFDATRNRPSTRRNFLLCPLLNIRHQFVVRLKDRGTKQYLVEDFLLFFTDVEAIEAASADALLHAAYASRFSPDLARNVMDQFCYSFREPSSAYSHVFIRAADILERKRVTGIPSTRSIITSSILYASYHLLRWQDTAPHALNVLSFARPDVQRHEIQYSPCLFLPPFIFNSKPDVTEETLNSSPALSKYIFAHRFALSGKRILEVGCGSGAVTSALTFLNGVAVIALDNDPRALEACRTTLGTRSTNVKLLCFDAENLVFTEADGRLRCRLEGKDEELDVVVVDLPLVTAPAGHRITELEKPYIAHPHEKSLLPHPLAKLLEAAGKVLFKTDATIVTSLFVETDSKTCNEPKTAASLRAELARLVPSVEIKPWSPERMPSDLGDIIDVFVLREHRHAQSP